MDASIMLTAALGAVSFTFSLLALQAAKARKAAAGQRALWTTFYWAALAGYAGFFTLVRLAAVLGASDGTLQVLYYIATSSGAATLIALTAIMLRVFAPRWSAILTIAATAAAVLLVALIIGPGVHGPSIGTWSVEFLPRLVLVRYLIAAVYMGIPVVFAILVLRAIRTAPDPTRRRFIMFVASVLLVYESNAIKYVVEFPDVVHLGLALLMAIGTYVGWQGYRPAAAVSSGNG